MSDRTPQVAARQDNAPRTVARVSAREWITRRRSGPLMGALRQLKICLERTLESLRRAEVRRGRTLRFGQCSPSITSESTAGFRRRPWATKDVTAEDMIEQAGLTQQAAAEKMGVSQPDVSNLLRGRFEGFSLERLLGFVVALGSDVEIKVKRRRDREHGEKRLSLVMV